MALDSADGGATMRRVRTLAPPVLAALLVVMGCDERASERGAQPPASSRAPSERDATVRLENEAFGESKRRLDQAVADLKAIGLWDDLTNHLYVVNIQSRPGTANIPDDRHLADAFLTAQIDEAGSGGLCSIMFFPAAVRAEYAELVAYAAEQPAYEPPSLRHFWASILGHELAHCFKGQPGEDVARRWEERVLQHLSATD
jgi:hypothetical protein